MEIDTPYHPTSEQVRAFVRDARRIERALSKTGGSRINPELVREKMNELILAHEGIVAPKGGRIYVTNIEVDYDRPWDDLLNGVGDVDADDEIRKADILYIKKYKGKVQHHLIFASFASRNINEKEMLDWGSRMNLSPADPRSIFTFGEQHRNLRSIFGTFDTRVYSLMPFRMGGYKYYPAIESGIHGEGIVLANNRIDTADDNWFGFFGKK